MVTGLNLAHGLRRSAQWPAMRGRPGHGLAAQPSPAEDTVHDGRKTGRAMRAQGAVTARSSHARRRGDALDGGAGWPVARCRQQAPVGSRGGVRQEERRRGSPRRSGDGGAAGSGQRGGVPVGGRLRRGGGALRAVPRLAAEAGKWLRARRRSGTKSTARRWGGIRPVAGGSALLKGSDGEAEL
jgi:hypothetical protein